RYPPELKAQVDAAIRKTERVMKKKFCDPKNPLLLSVRSGARISMPGMRETVLKIGLTSKTIPGLIKQTGGNARFVYDAYRRLITMYSDVVMEKAAGIEPKEGKGIRHQIEHLFEKKKKALGVTEDTDVGAEDLRDLCEDMKKLVKKVLGKSFPDDGEKQLWGGLGAVFASWNRMRAILYREVEGIPHEWGTAVNVQTMVFGNMGDTCATGVAFSRDPGRDHKDIFYGEYLVNAQGEDVVAGIRTPAPINKASQSDNNKHLVTLEKFMPKPYKELNAIQKRLERHYRDMQDIEFTIEDHKLFMLQCRVGKRNGTAAVRIAVDMVKEKLITEKEAVCRVTGDQLDEWLLDILDPKEEAKIKP
ncbi:MAG: pyruvate, phosphate dikinase, partial [Planctomycetes bacterium]|nr:pyruvate, phosphate dikinase [Planctomycetota bacterium]